MAADALFLDPDPLVTLVRWRDEAQRTGEREPDAMALATASLDGRPQVRFVLMRGVVDGRVRFYTNQESEKGLTLARNPYAALALHWASIGRQVRVEGPAEPLSAADSDAYFRTRPRRSQLGAWASPQSRPIDSLEPLHRRVAELDAEYAGREVPRPPHWGGYGVLAERVELWVAGVDRLHERRLYTRSGASWAVTQLAP
jgi:pyridoxamine 5'-phosphate oxidase